MVRAGTASEYYIDIRCPHRELKEAGACPRHADTNGNVLFALAPSSSQPQGLGCGCPRPWGPQGGVATCPHPAGTGAMASAASLSGNILARKDAAEPCAVPTSCIKRRTQCRKACPSSTYTDRSVGRTSPSQVRWARAVAGPVGHAAGALPAGARLRPASWMLRGDGSTGSVTRLPPPVLRKPSQLPVCLGCCKSSRWLNLTFMKNDFSPSEQKP